MEESSYPLADVLCYEEESSDPSDRVAYLSFSDYEEQSDYEEESSYPSDRVAYPSSSDYEEQSFASIDYDNDYEEESSYASDRVAYPSFSDDEEESSDPSYYIPSIEYDNDYEGESSDPSSSDDEEESSDPADTLLVQDTLRSKVSICEVLLGLAEIVIGKHKNIEEGQSEHLQAILIKIRTVFQKVHRDLRRADSRKLFRQKDSRNASAMLESLELLNPDIQQLYYIISSRSYSSGIIPREPVMVDLRLLRMRIEFLIKSCYTQILVEPVKEEHEAAKRNLSAFGRFLYFTSIWCTELDYLKDLVNYTELLVCKMSCLFYLCIKMNAAMLNEMKLKMHISSELHNFSPRQPVVRQIYIKFLKSSESIPPGYSHLVDEFRWYFLDSLRDDIVELSDATPGSFMVSYKGQILSMHEDLRILTATLANNELSGEIKFGIPDLYQIHTSFMGQIGAVIVDMGCLIYSLHNNKQNEDEEKELKTVVSRLQDTIKIAKEVAKKKYHRYVSTSELPKTKFLKTNGEVNIQNLMKNLRKIRGLMKNLRKIRGKVGGIDDNQSLGLFHKQLESVVGAFSKLIAEQQLDHEELEIQMTRFCDVINKTNHLISFLSNGWPRILENEFLLFVYFEEIKRIKMEFKDVHNGKMLRRINPQEKQTRIDNAVMISEYVADKMGEQQMNGSKTPNSLFPANVEKELCRLNNLDFINPLKDELRALKFSTAFLGVFFNCKGKWHIEDGNLKVLLTRIWSMCQIAAAEFSRLWADMIQILPNKLCCLPVNMDHIISSMLARLRLLQPDIQQVYTILSESPRFITGISEEAVMKNLNSLRENVDALLKYSTELVAPLKEELEAIQKRLRFLKSFLSFTAKRCSRLRQLKDLLILAEVLAEQISCLLCLYFFNYEMNDQMVNEMKMHFSAELHKFSLAQPHMIDMYIYDISLNDDENNKKMAIEPPDLVAMITDANEDIRKMYDQYVPKSLQSNFPRTGGQGFISSMLQKLKELLNTKDDLVAPLRYHIQIVQEELQSLREDFSKIEKQVSEYKGIQCQWTRFLDIAYQIEYVVDSFLAKNGPLCLHKLGLFNVVQDIKEIKVKLEAIKVKSIDETLVGKAVSLSNQVSLESDIPKENAVLGSKERLPDEKCSTKLLILREEAEKIRVQLTNGSRKLQIISIVGMPGIGKTTLADSVFRDPSVTHHFHAVGRCSVSQVFDKRRLLLEILQQVSAQGKQNDDDDDNDLAQKLYQSLKGRRFLILLDDIWDIQPWEDIKLSFPDDKIGSRIIFTSRSQVIATKAGLENTNYHLSLLSDENSWEMLQMKLFGSKSCPAELVSVGREIAVNCMGLPLTIDLVAGFLRVKEKKEWKKVAKSLMTLLFEDPEGRCQKVLELSYQNLPDDLRPCFLYFAAFPEDKHVPTRDLISLWIAEGFFQFEEDDLRSLEDMAKDILNNLTSRSLIIVFERDCFGEVSLSGVHDLLHEFVVEKAQEESFLPKTNGTLSSVGCHDQWREQYRLCIHPNNWSPFLKSNPSGPRTRSLISSFSTRRSTEFSMNFKAFKLLTVLYIPDVTCSYCPEMFTLVHLRILAFHVLQNVGAINIISKIHKLYNLQTFILKSFWRCTPFVGHAHLLLDKICKMERLRHLCFEGFVSFRYHSEKIWEMSSVLNNLRTLYHFTASYDEDIEKILKLMPNLVELKALFYVSTIPKLDCLQNSDEYIYAFPKLDLLMKLESLEVKHMVDYDSHPCKIININFPPYLKKLVLSHFGLLWTEMSEIGNLDTLEILELQNGAFKGPVWEMIDGQFPKLKHLTLSSLNIVKWNASEDHLSSLEGLHVESCIKLKKLPLCLAETATLKEIVLLDCSESAYNSAKRIKEEQLETGNEQLVVEID